MGIAERKERQKVELRDRILKAAREIVLKDGYDALTMRKIAQKIEYAPGTIYLHFASRDEIALQLVQSGFSELLTFLAPVTAITDPLERIEAIGRGYAEFGLSHPETYRLIFMEDPKFTDEVLTMQLAPRGEPGSPGDQAFTLVFQTCDELIRKGIFKPIDPELCTYILWSTMHGIVSLQIACAKAAYPDPKKLTEATLAMTRHGLMA